MSYVAAFKSGISLVARLMFLHKFALASHRVLTVLVCMVKIGSIDTHSHNSRRNQHSRSLEEVGYTLLHNGIDQICHHHKHLRNEEIVCHLHMVGQNLKSAEQGSQHTTPQIFASEAKHHSRYRWRNICKSQHFPYMTSSYDDEEIA